MRTRKTKTTDTTVKANGNGASRRGRPPAMVYLNFAVRTSTRNTLNDLVARTGLGSQGAVLDQLMRHFAKQPAAAKRLAR